MTMRTPVCLALSAIVMLGGCNNVESKSQFRVRAAVQSGISSTMDAIHRDMVKLADSPSVDLVSQGASEDSGPERVEVKRHWLLVSPDQSSPVKDKAALISSCESILKEHVPPQSADPAAQRYEAKVEDEKEGVRVSVVARWNRASK